MDGEFRFTNTYRKLVEGSNINGTSLLATDYLNHFNEVAMLIEMAADMPEILEEAKEWKPASYAEHFERSTFSDKELAIWAYENAPSEFTESFEAIVATANELVIKTIKELSDISLNSEPEMFREEVKRRSKLIYEVLEKIGGIINGSVLKMDQNQIDELFA